MFGLTEDKGEGVEQLRAKVDELMQDLGEKPRFDAVRIGKLSSKDSLTRPVKVNLGSSVVVSQILEKAKRLARSPKHNKVYISPDRSPTQRAEHRALVQELKDKRITDPNKRYYLRNGTIVSADIKT